MRKIPIQNLEDIIDRFVNMQIMLDNGYHTVGELFKDVIVSFLICL